MPVEKKKVRFCKNGHQFYKSSVPIAIGSPTCPICESEKNKDGFLAVLSAPARRALVNNGKQR